MEREQTAHYVKFSFRLICTWVPIMNTFNLAIETSTLHNSTVTSA